MIFHGPAGTGKTTMASDQRGIDVIRDLAKMLRFNSLLGKKKLVFLDEAEQLTNDAWKALKKVMEQGKAIFIIATNNFNGIPEPIRSRAIHEEFQRYNPDECHELVKLVEKKLGKKFNDDDVKKAIDLSGGDLRKLVGDYLKKLADGLDIVVKKEKSLIEKLKEIINKLPKNANGVYKLVDTMKMLRKKMGVMDVISAIVEASDSLDVGIHAGHVAGYINGGTPEEIELVSLACMVIKTRD